jgi:hypothetical protein
MLPSSGGGTNEMRTLRVEDGAVGEGVGVGEVAGSAEMVAPTEALGAGVLFCAGAARNPKIKMQHAKNRIFVMSSEVERSLTEEDKYEIPRLRSE